jgi:hypothetical protein
MAETEIEELTPPTKTTSSLSPSHSPSSMKESNNIPFWGSDPNILFSPGSILELFPVSGMTYAQKLNAVSRLVIFLIVVFYIVLRTGRVFIMGILTLAAIWVLEYTQTKKKHVTFEEGFRSSAAEDYVNKNLLPTNIFGEATESNPLQNVMMTDYDAPTSKKPATAAYLPESQKNIMEQTKNMIDEINPEQPKISEKLFRSLDDNLAFEQSMRPFYSNPSTTIPNDQGAFSDFCYGGMISCKEGNPFACARNLSRHTN